MPEEKHDYMKLPSTCFQDSEFFPGESNWKSVDRQLAAIISFILK